MGSLVDVTLAPVNVKYSKLFINGEFVDSVTGETFETLDPRTGEVIIDVAKGGKGDVDLAVKAARQAFDKGPWPRMSGSARGRVLLKLAELFMQHKDELAALETLDNGKPIAMFNVFDAPVCAGFLQYCAGWADKIHGQTCKMDGPYMGYTLHEPIGVVGQIIPWNFPMIMFILKIAPALACGCTIVIKPAEQTPLTALFVANLAKEAGIPDGVLNVITGFGDAGAAISSHMDIDKVAFTGSTEVGRLIMTAAAKSNLKPVSLELGGKSPVFVMEDADIDEAVEIAHTAVFTNMGQVCLAGTRIFVQESIYDEFVKKAAERARKQVVGDPFREDVNHGPQVDEAQFKKTLEYIELGKEQGAKLVEGGNPCCPNGKGYYIKPTIFTDVEDDMSIAREEIFGPVMSVLKFKTIEEAIERGNKTIYGLGAGIVTKSIGVANRMSRSLKAGTVWINCYAVLGVDIPIGGYKMSGFGREFGEYNLHSYLQVKSVIMPLQDSPWL